VVDIDGVSPVSFPASVTAGNYHIAIRHRNHLGIRTPSPQTFSTTTTTSYNFTTASIQAFGTNPMAQVGALFAMWGGNANSNTNVRYTGLSNDPDRILITLGSNTAAILSNIYSNSDVNMNGTVRYSGLSNDPNFILSVLGGNTANIIIQQLE